MLRQPLRCNVFINYVFFLLQSTLTTADVTTQIVKVNVTPASRANIHQAYTSFLTDIATCIPALTSHRLSALSSRFSDNLENKY